MLSQRTIAANASFYITALTIQKALSFIYFSYLARSLGTVLTGKYFFAMSFAGIVIAFMDVGLTPVLTREIAQDNAKASAIVSTVVTLKLLLSSLAVIVLALIIPLQFHDSVDRTLLFIALAIAVFDTFTLTFFATVRAHQNLFFESISAIGFQLIVLAFGGYAIYQHYDVWIIVLALLTASLVNMLFAWHVVRSKLHIAIRFMLDTVLVKRMAKFAVPFALAAIFIKVYAYSDTVMLKFFADDHYVGLYSVPYKITFAFQFIPMAFVAALYPAFSYYWQHERDQLRSTFEKSLKYLLIISLPLAAGIIALAPKLIPAIYTNAYDESVLPLMILVCSLPFLFLNFPIGSLLNATRRQNRQTLHLGITMTVNIILNLILIPPFHVVGAALASTLSTLFIFILGMYVSYDISRFDRLQLAKDSIKILITTGAMYLMTIGMIRFVPWYLVIVPAGLFYAILLHFLGILRLQEIKNIKSLLSR